MTRSGIAWALIFLIGTIVAAYVFIQPVPDIIVKEDIGIWVSDTGSRLKYPDITEGQLRVCDEFECGGVFHPDGDRKSYRFDEEDFRSFDEAIAPNTEAENGAK